MSDFIKSFRKAEKLVASKQNRENAIALIGSDKFGNESFIQWIQASDKIHDLRIGNVFKKVTAKAGTCDRG